MKKYQRATLEMLESYLEDNQELLSNPLPDVRRINGLIRRFYDALELAEESVVTASAARHVSSATLNELKELRQFATANGYGPNGPNYIFIRKLSSNFQQALKLAKELSSEE